MKHQIVKLAIIFTFVLLFLFIGKTNTVFGDCKGTYECNVKDMYGDCVPSGNIVPCSGDEDHCSTCANVCGVICGAHSSDCWWSEECTPDWPDPLCDGLCGHLVDYTVGDGCGNVHWCDATGPCCSATDPDTPTLSAPGTGTTVPVNQSVNLDWDAISSWGTGCPQDNDYEVCVMSNNSTCDYVNLTAQGETNTNYNGWTPTVGDTAVYWKIRAHNGSNRATSSTWNFCVEDQLCTSPQCGEVRKCGTPNCPNTDNGAPEAPTIISPSGTSDSPTLIAGNAPQAVTLSWNAVEKAERYIVGLYNSAGTVIWNPTDITTTSTTTAELPAGVYHWRVRGVNDDCTVGQQSEASNFGYFRINSPPTIVKILVANSNTNLVPNDNTTDNHICKSEFMGTTNPREVVFGIFINDPEGVGDSGPPPVLHWNGQNYPTAWTGTGGGNNAAQVRVDYASYVGAPPQSLHEVTATYSDRWGASVVSTLPVLPTNRLNWKVWDCQVPTSGTLYKAVDAQQICFNGTGFSEPVDVGVSFDSIIFSDSPDVTMTVTKPAYFGTNSIVWGKTYLPLINGGSLLGDIDGDLLADVRKTRIIDLAVGTTTCPSGSSLEIGYTTAGVYNVNPYSSEPRARIDFSFIRDQEAWYQVVGAGVKSRNDLEYGVPVTAPAAIKFLTLGNSTVYNGLVSATSFDNINGNNNNEFGGPLPYENWYLGQNTNDDDIYNYNYFYNNFYVKTGIGEIKNNSWGGWATNQIYFVNENLNINQNLSVANGETMMVIVSGDIIIDPSVTQLDGIYVADGEISAGGINGSQLVINGMLYAGGDIRLYRSFVVKRINNTTPAVKVNYSPGLIFNLPPEIMRVLSGWREE
ncbi:MAG: hypothetical protein PHR98_02080 [Candidatus Shapirobacteria bacterium]|nr:hypothetical protein [Candidatus Shapirobacteria bacterium]